MAITGQITRLTRAFGDRELFSKAAALQREGDNLRDERNFARAADTYEKYLKLRPNDFEIWVQRGNCLKEAGKPAAARLAYEYAAALNNDDADLHLQMGHLMKVQGHTNEAVKHYRKSHELDPSSGLAARELSSLGLKPSPANSPLEKGELANKPAKIFDISDLLTFLDVHNRVTGIQRVQSCIIHEIIASTDNLSWTSSFDGHDIVFAFCDQLRQTIYAVSSATVNALLDLVQSKDPTQQEVSECLDRLRASKIVISPRGGDIYVILGAFWIGNDYSGTLVALRQSAVKIGVYIYDLIPITHPQFVVESTRHEFVEKFADIMSLVDFVLTISDYVAGEVASVLRNELNRALPIYSVPLSHELSDSAAKDAELDAEFAASLPKDFVLCVCTIEGRKNHSLLLNAWSSLNRKHAGNIPHLVLVGRWGWRVEEFRSQLESQHNVDGKIIVMGNLPDPQLKLLYQHCLFTVFPSFVEGWGLPVGESLAYGKPCIASNTSSIPEVGGDFCRYINPYETLTAIAEIERAFLDRDDLRKWTARIVDDFKVRTWADVTSDFLTSVDAAAPCDKSEKYRAAVILDAGRAYNFGRSETDVRDKATWASRAVKFVCSAGWWPIESWGVWSFSRTARIQFGTNLPARARIRLLLHLRLPPPTDCDSLKLTDKANNSKVVYFSTGLPKWIQMESEVDEFGVATIELERLGQVQHIEPNRELYCGVSSIAFHARDDLASRMDIMESLLLFEAG
jgi:glycosyltransferase involved in cell wall biosynthesis